MRDYLSILNRNKNCIQKIQILKKKHEFAKKKPLQSRKPHSPNKIYLKFLGNLISQNSYVNLFVVHFIEYLQYRVVATLNSYLNEKEILALPKLHITSYVEFSSTS